MQDASILHIRAPGRVSAQPGATAGMSNLSQWPHVALFSGAAVAKLGFVCHCKNLNTKQEVNWRVLHRRGATPPGFCASRWSSAVACGVVHWVVSSGAWKLIGAESLSMRIGAVVPPAKTRKPKVKMRQICSKCV